MLVSRLRLVTERLLRLQGAHRVFSATSRCFHLAVSSLSSDPYPSLPYILKQNNIPEADRKKIEDEVNELTKDWISYGHHRTDKAEDLFRFYTTGFVMFVLCGAGISFYLWYFPDRWSTEWAKREAFLELERRRRDGLPLIDRDFLPPSRVHLPSEDELSPEFKIII